jgi:hypothetical protein
MFTFIPLALIAVGLQPELMEWVDSLCGTGNNSWLTPEGWYVGSSRIGTYVWCPTPAADDAALEQLCKTASLLRDTVLRGGEFSVVEVAFQA